VCLFSIGHCIEQKTKKKKQTIQTPKEKRKTKQ
jgi:hypothetical protein